MIAKQKTALATRPFYKDQIAFVLHVNMDKFKAFTENTKEKDIISKGLIKYDDSTYYEDLGVDSIGRRHILVFNLELLNDQRQAREKLIEKAMRDLEDEKKSLLTAAAEDGSLLERSQS